MYANMSDVGGDARFQHATGLDQVCFAFESIIRKRRAFIGLPILRTYIFGCKKAKQHNFGGASTSSGGRADEEDDIEETEYLLHDNSVMSRSNAVADGK